MTTLSNKGTLGRNKEPGDTKPLLFRCMSDAEWEAVAAMTPMQRTQACLLYSPEIILEIVPILQSTGYDLPEIYSTEKEYSHVSPIQRRQAYTLFKPEVLDQIIPILRAAGYELPAIFSETT